MANLMTMLAWDVGGTEGLPPHTLSSPFLRGVGLSFLFAGPLILLVFSTFLVGGNVQTLVCQSWESGELYEVGGGRCEQRKRVRRKWGPEKARGRTGKKASCSAIPYQHSNTKVLKETNAIILKK